MGTKKQKGAARKKRRSAKMEAKAIVRAEYTAIALELRKQAYTYREIADLMAEAPEIDADGRRLNYGIGQRVPQSTLHLWVNSAIKEIPLEAATDLRQMHLDRLDTLLQRAWADVIDGQRMSPDALKAVMQIMDRQARYCGLYAPEGAGESVNRITEAISNLEADRPILRPDGPVPANPVL